MRELIRYEDIIIKKEDVTSVGMAFDENFDAWCFIVNGGENGQDELFRVMASPNMDIHDEMNFLTWFLWGEQGAGFVFDSVEQKFKYEVGCAANVTLENGIKIYTIPI